ncbi:MAG: hypothetical protein ACHQAY_12900 [Hyphomicrobiales bacterium]
MDAFFLSALASFSLTLLLMASTATQAGDNIKLKVGRSLELTAVRRLFVFVASIAATLLVAIVFLLVLARIHPQSSAIYSWGDFLSGPIFSSVVLGLLFGVLFAFWLRELLRLRDDQAIQRKQVVQAIVLAILLTLGAFSDVLRSYAGRIAQISLGGAQVNFTPASNSVETVRPGVGAVYAKSDASSTSAEAIRLITNLSGRIASDTRYISKLFPRGIEYSDSPSSKGPGLFELNGRIASCLSRIRDVSADESFGQAHLRELLAIVHRIEVSGRRLDPPAAGKRIAEVAEERIAEAARESISKLADELVSYIDQTYLHLDSKNQARMQVQKECAPFIFWACSSESIEDAKAKERPDTGTVAGNCESFAPTRPDKIGREVMALMDDQGLLDRPHLALLEAGLLWSLGQHRGAVEALDRWLIGVERNENSSKTATTHPWYKARARIHLGIIVEDWMRTSPDSPPGLLEYHIENLAATAALMKQLLREKIDALGDLDADLQTEDFAQGLPAAGFKCLPLDYDAAQLLLTWLSIYPSYMVKATQSASFESYSADVMTARRLVLKKDVFCLANAQPELRADVGQFYADFLEAYAEVEMANAERIALLPDQDAVKRSLDHAYHAATLGLQLIRAYPAEGRSGDEGDAVDPRSLKAHIESKHKFDSDIEARLKSVQARTAGKMKSL